MWANLLIIGSLLTASVGLAELILSKKQIEQISIHTIKLWSWLDNLKSKSILLAFKSKLIQLLIYLTATCYCIYSMGKGFGPGLEVFTYILLLIAIVIGLTTNYFVFKAKSMKKAIERFIFMTTIVLSIILLFFTVMTSYPLGNMKPDDLLLIRTIDYIGAIIVIYLFLIVYASFWLILGSVLLVINVFYIFIRVTEFLVRRIAEYEKGPIVGGGLALAFIAGIYKAFA